jgi:anion-transporting  ArsA/GET3 family ATPase
MGWFDSVTETVSNVTNTVTESASNVVNTVTETTSSVVNTVTETTGGIINTGSKFADDTVKEAQKELTNVEQTTGTVISNFEKEVIKEDPIKFIDSFSHQIIKDTGGYVEEGKKIFDSTSEIIGNSIGEAVSKVEEELYEGEKVVEQTIGGAISKGSDVVKDIGGQISNVGGLIENESQKLFWDYLGNPIVVGAGIVGLILLL